ASDLRHALAAVHGGRRRAVVPPLLDAWATHAYMSERHPRGPRRPARRHAASGPSATSRMEVAMAEIEQGVEAQEPPVAEATPAEPLPVASGPIEPDEPSPAAGSPAFVFAVGGAAPRFPSVA